MEKPIVNNNKEEIKREHTCNSDSVTSISPRYTKSMIVFRSVNIISPGRTIVGCLQGFSNRSFWKYEEQADKTT